MSKRDTINKLIMKITEFEKAYKHAVDSRTSKLGVTPSQYKVLKALDEKGPMKHKDVSEITLITKGTLTGVVNRLERAGLVSRTQDAKDSRAQYVALTEKGQTEYARLEKSYRKIIGNIFNPESEEKLKQYITNLNVLVALVRQGETD
ncbi:MarR family transcriptional regulator [Desulfurispirillum indicum]|uniref:Regulatory protein MarR n=1 Tax=Desulfurispirillum indicum (strain ATCC BAA-1389 / DSM 22839 / S5) TaxID=653733 RepID=E6W0Q9_DESIS|nr:MarR family transcriptional regulator [Desulfurispirillum indicum]ADU66404.1 regulatory protein MarR [Desulfurispirillum indicum S5]UCZ55736.1 MarR family transcriptional regulator [Desulfurispirillum indicum]